METKCVRCEESIAEEQFELNQGYCRKCWNRIRAYLAMAEDLAEMAVEEAK